MKKIYVFHQENLVGTLKKNDNLNYFFEYSEDWLKSDISFSLSFAMPLQKKEFENKVTLSFFENLLPEGEIRDLFTKNLHTDNPFEFLKKYGRDCAGAFTLSESKSPPSYRSQANILTKIEHHQIYEALEQKMPVSELMLNLEHGFLSIAGAQDKFIATYQNNGFFISKNGQPTTHIIKTPIMRPGIKNSVYNEFFCMSLAKKVGLKVPHFEVLDHAKFPLYIIQRFDREGTEQITRLHQQDFCQAQGFVSSEKYEARGGPSLKDNYLLIQKHVSATTRADAIFQYLNWICFNLLIGNNDCHSKNISLLHTQNNKITLASFYDIICTSIYPNLEKKFSYQVGDTFDVDRIGKKQLLMTDEQLELKQGTMRVFIQNMTDKILAELPHVQTNTEKMFPRSQNIAQQLVNLISKKCKYMTRKI